MEKKPGPLKLLMTLAFSALGERAFMNRTVGEILWGYEDPLVHIINKYLPDMFPVKGKFGLFSGVSMSQREAHSLCPALRVHTLETSLLWSWLGALGTVDVNGRISNSHWLK